MQFHNSLLEYIGQAASSLPHLFQPPDKIISLFMAMNM